MRKNKKIALILSFALILSLTNSYIPSETIRIAEAATPDFSAATAVSDPGTGFVSFQSTGVHKTDGIYRLEADLKYITIKGLDITLDLNGHSIKKTDGTDYAAIDLSAGAKLKLYDTKSSAKITGTVSHGGNGGGIYITGNSTLEMYGGSISDCVVSKPGGSVFGAGVYVGSGSTFVMNDGSITNNKISTIGGLSRGAGIYSAGTTVINGGKISNNQTTEPSGGTVYGAAVDSESDISITGGEISANGTSSDKIKGTIYINNGKLSMSGGTITGNHSPGIWYGYASVELSGTADISSQSANVCDIYVPEDGASLGFSHSAPTRAGKKFILHKDSITGEDVTESYKMTTLTVIQSLFVEWKDDTAPTTAPTGIPSASPSSAPSLTPNPSVTPSVSPAPSGSPSSSASPNPSSSPAATASPAEGRDSEEYQGLSDEDKKSADDLVKNYNDIDYQQAAQIIEYVNENKIDKNIIQVSDEVISNHNSEEDPQNATFGKLRLRITKRYKQRLKLKWTKLPKAQADGYELYTNRCNSNGVLRPLKKKLECAQNVSTYTDGRRKQNVYYKYLIRAYKNIAGKRITTAVSVCVHGTPLNNKENTVAKSVYVFINTSNRKKEIGNKITLRAGESIRLKSKEIPEESEKTIRPHRKVLYESGNKSVAKIGKNTGVLRAKSKGATVIYAYAQNGIYKRIKVVVKAKTER